MTANTTNEAKAEQLRELEEKLACAASAIEEATTALEEARIRGLDGSLSKRWEKALYEVMDEVECEADFAGCEADELEEAE